jgi:hypothetical protein
MNDVITRLSEMSERQLAEVFDSNEPVPVVFAIDWTVKA